MSHVMNQHQLPQTNIRSYNSDDSAIPSTKQPSSIVSAMNTKFEQFKARLKLMTDKQKRISPYGKYVRQQLRYVGISGLDLLHSETHYLSNILYPSELVLGAVFGTTDTEGSALLVVSDQRIIYINQVAASTNFDEIGYESVNGISSTINSWNASITLHTDVGDYKLHSVSISAANNFIYVIDKYCINASRAVNKPE